MTNMPPVNKELYTPISIVLGCLLISLAILLSNGVISIQGLKAGNKATNPTPSDTVGAAPQTGEIKISLQNDDRIRGDKASRVILFEYSDLECPFCKSFHPTAKQLVEEYPGQVAWVYRHFPIEQLHSQAKKEAEATECAFQLGGEESFWKLVDKIYEVTPSNDGLNLDDLPKLASGVGLDQASFQTCMTSGKGKERVEKDYQSGASVGVSGTPGNILLDTKTGKTIMLRGAEPLENVKKAVDTLLNS